MIRRTLLAVTAAAFAACSGAQPAPTETAPHTAPPAPAPALPPAPPPETPRSARVPLRPPPVIAQTADAPFRANEPAAEHTGAFVPPRIQDFHLRNGLRVLLVERHELPVVSAQFVTRHGADDAPADRPGLASLTGSLLEQGTVSRDALALSDAFAAIGAEHGSSMSWDSGGAFVKCLAPNLPAALELLADVLEHPAFAPDQLERARARRLGSLREELDSPRAIAGRVAARAIYGETHPYSRALAGTEEGVRAITREDVLRFYQTHFTPQDGALVVAGDVTRAALTPALERAFGAWRVAAARAPAVPAAPAPGGPRIWLVDRPGAPQSAVIVGHAGVPRASRDYAPLVVMNTILGGMFSSRINLNLREAHAYTYGAGSGFSFRHGAGPFAVSSAIAVANTAPAVHEIFTELDRMRASDVTADELAAAKARVTETLPAVFETTDATAGAVAELFTYGLPLTEYATITQRINAVTAADVRRVATRYLDPAHARVIVVGDRHAVEPALTALSLGPLEVRSPLGAPVAAPPAAPAPVH